MPHPRRHSPLTSAPPERLPERQASLVFWPLWLVAAICGTASSCSASACPCSPAATPPVIPWSSRRSSSSSRTRSPSKRSSWARDGSTSPRWDHVAGGDGSGDRGGVASGCSPPSSPSPPYGTSPRRRARRRRRIHAEPQTYEQLTAQVPALLVRESSTPSGRCRRGRSRRTIYAVEARRGARRRQWRWPAARATRRRRYGDLVGGATELPRRAGSRAAVAGEAAKRRREASTRRRWCPTHRTAVSNAVLVSGGGGGGGGCGGAPPPSAPPHVVAPSSPASTAGSSTAACPGRQCALIWTRPAMCEQRLRRLLRRPRAQAAAAVPPLRRRRPRPRGRAPAAAPPAADAADAAAPRSPPSRRARRRAGSASRTRLTRRSFSTAATRVSAGVRRQSMAAAAAARCCSADRAHRAGMTSSPSMGSWSRRQAAAAEQPRRRCRTCRRAVDDDEVDEGTARHDRTGDAMAWRAPPMTILRRLLMLSSIRVGIAREAVCTSIHVHDSGHNYQDEDNA